jgi:transposase
MPIKAIARLLGVSKNTVKAAIASSGPPRYERAPRGSIVDAVEPRLHEFLRQWPDMPATVIAERIGWTNSMTVLKDRVRELRPVYLPPDPASRTTYEPGELAQCDLWFPDADIPLGAGQNGQGKTPVITMVAGYSRVLSGLLIPSRCTEDLFAGQWELIRQLGAVPRALVWDGEGAVGRWRGRRQELTQATQAFRGTLGIKVVLCKPGDPEAKGLVERAHRYLETSFLPGRTFRDPHDFNAQLTSWLPRANARVHRRIGCRPSDRIKADRAAMLPLPPVAPSTGWSYRMRLPRDHYVRLDANDYSVHPDVIGRLIEVTADLEQVRVTCEGRLVADHRRCWARHQSLTDPSHAKAAEALREKRARLHVQRAEVEVERRALADYDRALGVDLPSPLPSGPSESGSEGFSEPGLSEGVA